MNKFTPGPWYYYPGIYGRAPMVQRGDQGGFFVIGLTPESQEADAQLIAGAPDLYSAAEWALSTIAEYRAGGGIETEQHMKRAHEQLYAAVAKVREAV
jgi:hypothetical protein